MSADLPPATGAFGDPNVLRSVVRIGLPMAGTQFAFMLLGVVDTALLGHLSPLALGASAIGNMWNWAFLSIALGFVLGAEPFVTQAFGRRDGDEVALGVQRALVTAFVVSIPTMACVSLTGPALVFLGQPKDVADAAATYNLWRLPSIPAFLSYISLRLFLQGRGTTSPALGVAVIANVLNLAFGYALIFGAGPFPAWGLAGAAIAATLTSILLPLGLLVWIKHRSLDRNLTRPWDEKSWSRSGLRSVMRLGGPMALQTGVEAWGFVIAMILAGWMGVSELGSHQIGMNIAALAFMLPLGIAIGGSTSVGHRIGEGDLPAAKLALKASFGLALAWSVIAGPSLYFGRHMIAGWFTSDPAILSTVAMLIVFVACYQPVDAAQAVGAGVLRGMGRPGAPAIMNFIGFLIGLPLAYLLGVRTGYGILAIWGALALRLCCVSAGVTYWAFRTARRPLSELTVRSES